jgi:4-hydroxybutyrate dehydrogenase
MQALRLVPKVFYFETFKEFNDEFKIGKKDLLITNEWLYTPYAAPLGLDTNVIYQEKYGAGEPSDEMIDAMAKDMKKFDFDRIVAFGGGTIVDICKILALDLPEKSHSYQGRAARHTVCKATHLLSVNLSCRF